MEKYIASRTISIMFLGSSHLNRCEDHGRLLIEARNDNHIEVFVHTRKLYFAETKLDLLNHFRSIGVLPHNGLSIGQGSRAPRLLTGLGKFVNAGYLDIFKV